MKQYILIKTNTFTSFRIFRQGKAASYGSRIYLGIGEIPDIMAMIEEDFTKEIDSFKKHYGETEPYISWGNFVDFMRYQRPDGVKTFDCFIRSYTDEYMYDEDYKYTVIPTDTTRVQIF